MAAIQIKHPKISLVELLFIIYEGKKQTKNLFSKQMKSILLIHKKIHGLSAS